MTSSVSRRFASYLVAYVALMALLVAIGMIWVQRSTDCQSAHFFSPPRADGECGHLHERGLLRGFPDRAS